MSQPDVSIADQVAKTAIDAYKNLHKNGKPIEQEWTVLSCVLQNNKTTEQLEVVALGTGSKCIGANRMSPKGDVLNDSHAEVVARRGFLVYLYDNMKRTLEDKTTIFIIQDNKFKLKDDIEFYFYSSQLPCGDACIMPKFVDETHVGDVLKSNKRHAGDNSVDDSDVESKRPKVDNNDIHRTGAKCLPHCDQDMKDPGVNYHLTGQVRTKPGRGDRTLSVSCSDKISRWIHLGINGALLDMLLHDSIFIKLFVFGGGVPYSQESLERALLRRNLENPINLNCIPDFQQSTITFPNIKTEENERPAPGSIVWIQLQCGYAEVAVQGRKLGVTKKKAALLSSSLCISKYNLYKRFLGILLLSKEVLKNVSDKETLEGIPYNVMKSKSKRYLDNWTAVKNQFFGMWTIKPDIWNFCVELTQHQIK